jgi:hypothetical protein
MCIYEPVSVSLLAVYYDATGQGISVALASAVRLVTWRRKKERQEKRGIILVRILFSLPDPMSIA